MDDGLKTFPFPVKLDDRIALVEAEFGCKGFAVVWKLHQAIHARGYYMKWDIDTQLLFIRDYCLSEVGRNAVSEIVACCIRRGVFDSLLYKNYDILTSKRIQETFLMAKERSKKVIIEKDYALPIVYEFIENARKKDKNVNIFFKNADICEQSKEKEKKEEEIPPTPQEGEAWGASKERFLNAYPKLKGKQRYDDSGVDYDILIDRFARSEYLHNTFSMNWVCKNYERIVSGVFDDADDAKSAADMRTEREQYYAKLRHKAISKAEKACAIAEKDEAFKAAEAILKKGEIELARAEIYAPETMVDIKIRLTKARKERDEALSRLNLTDEDLQPKFACGKCSDTGFLPSGKMCDCYGKNNGEKS